MEMLKPDDNNARIRAPNSAQVPRAHFPFLICGIKSGS